MDKYAPLKLENQLCFPLYAASREVVKRYRPHLDALGLTYTQYIAMMVIWEETCVSAKALGERLLLDSGTLTPVLKALEQKGYIRRYRPKDDERVLMAALTESGERLRDEALRVPAQMASCVALSRDEAATLLQLLQKLMDNEPDSAKNG